MTDFKFDPRALRIAALHIDPGSPEDIAIQLTQGRILVCSPTATPAV
jgi:hypothetical protein